jgi:biopolymer transport protein TolQ
MLIKNLEKVALLGSTWVLWLLIGLSAISIGIMFERWFYFRRYSGNSDALGAGLVRLLRIGDRRGAEELLQKSRSFEARVILPTLEWLDGGAEAFAEAVDASMNKKRRDLERGLVFLGTLGNNAPFVGLLGTVIGVIDAFHMLGSAGGGQNQAAMGNVMVGISEALIATGVGLMVAIPAVVGYNIAQKKVGEIDSNVQTIAKDMLALLKADAKLINEFRALNEEPPEYEESPEPPYAHSSIEAEMEPS